MRFDPSTSILAGMDTTALQARLTQMQNDYLDLASGRKLESANYTQGDGGKGLTYTRATLAELGNMIRLVQAQLGIICSPRRAIGVRFL